jgi:hypothetical protein
MQRIGRQEIMDFFYIAAADPCRISFGQLPQMRRNIELFPSTQDQVYTRYGSNFSGFQLGVTTGHYDHAARGPALDPADQLAALFIGVVGDGTGIQYIYIGYLFKFTPGKAFLFQ